MASPSELGLIDCKPHSYSMLLKSFGGDQTDQTYKLEEFLSHLEEERLKIDAFKRELPLCMQLLTNAMEASRQQLQAYRVNQGTRPVLEEFMPVKHNLTSAESCEKATNIVSDKANWMTSAQLWSQTSEGITKQQQSTIMTSPKEADIGFSMSSPKPILDNKLQRNNGGAFLPFSKERNPCSQGCTLRTPLPELSLVSTEKEMMEDKKHGVSEAEKLGISCQKRDSNNNNNSVNDGAIFDQGNKGSPVASSHAQTTTTTNTSNSNTNQTHRKARRCWSPDLHRRFVNALQMLGGSQVATPKQIRELMKVDGLTNDEVKSHLQKYRLHTRRPSASPQTGAPAAQLVVLGGIWVPPEYAAHAGTPAALYGAHPTSHAHVPPPHYCAPGQDFYTAAAPPPHHPLLPPPHQPHHHHQQLHVYKATPHGHGTPESAGDRSESIEDGKSESSSWKGESGDNEGDNRKGLAEESNGSEITLKF